MMLFSHFTQMVDKLPDAVRVTFSGFSEPSINPYFTQMVRYAAARHPVAVFTTAICLTQQDVDRLAKIKYPEGPNGGFCLHLPDVEGYTSIGADDPFYSSYLSVLRYIRDAEISGFWTIAAGQVPDEVAQIFPAVPVMDMWSRAGNLQKERVVEKAKSIERPGPRTCGCAEGLEHIVAMPDGAAYLCCQDFGLQHRLGNLLEQSYESLIPAPGTAFGLCDRCENSVEAPRSEANAS